MRKLTLFLVISACTYTRGDGNIVTKERQIDPFRKLSVESGIDLAGVVGARSLTVTTDANVVDLVETLVDGDTLTVRRKPDSSSDAKVIVFVNNDAFENISASGGNDVNVAASPVATL